MTITREHLENVARVAAEQFVKGLEAERDTARGAVRELERQVFTLQQQRDVLQTCLDRHQRDEADPPGYLQDAVVRAAGLGALHTGRDAAIKERDALRARLDAAAGQEPVAWTVTHWSGTGPRDFSFDGPPDVPTLRDSITNPVWDPLYAAPVSEQASLSRCLPDGIRYALPPLVLTGHQIKQALDFVNPDFGAGTDIDAHQMGSTVCIALRGPGKDTDGGPAPAGLYCWLEECPEEGSIMLAAAPGAAR